mmetsp:Transcript_30598/g.79360  ORF Transcript_30598/g.79360 Transcript_30598/m.79360 type:complete len:317 (-) Transcript_30598:439-1389(-)
MVAVAMMDGVKFAVGNDTFHLGEKLGAGKFGEVFQCKGEDRCVKVSSTEEVDKQVQPLLLQMRSPNVVTHFAFAQHESVSLTLMSSCAGDGLTALIDRNLTNEDDIARLDTTRRLMSEVLAAVSAIHAIGIVHRDVKPDNFRASCPGGPLQLLDFGFAVFVGERGDLVDGENSAGTLCFVSPEAVQGKVGKPCDIWATGVTMYSAVAGHYPFEANSFESLKQLHSDTLLTTELLCRGDKWRMATQSARDVQQGLLCVATEERLTAEAALKMPFFVAPVGSTKQEPAVQRASPLLRARARVFGGCADLSRLNEVSVH